MEKKNDGIVVVGSCNIDLITYSAVLPLPGQTVLGTDFKKGFGGKGANQAVMIAKLNGNVSMIAKLGQDLFGDETKKNFSELGVNIDHVFTTNSAPSGVAQITVDTTKGMNYIIVVSGSNNLLTKEDIKSCEETISKLKILICQLEVPLETTLEALKIGKKHNVFTIFNPAPALQLPEEIFQYCDIICPNETECEVLTGQSVHTIEEATKAGRILLEKGAKTVLITLGERGCLIVTPNESTLIPGEKVTPIDTTGAGDCFIGSLAYFLSKGVSLHESCKRANLIASISVQHFGTQVSYPTKKELPSSLF